MSFTTYSAKYVNYHIYDSDLNIINDYYISNMRNIINCESKCVDYIFEIYSKIKSFDKYNCNIKYVCKSQTDYQSINTISLEIFEVDEFINIKEKYNSNMSYYDIIFNEMNLLYNGLCDDDDGNGITNMIKKFKRNKIIDDLLQLK